MSALQAVADDDPDTLPPLDGCVALMESFWELVHDDLRSGWAGYGKNTPGLDAFYFLHAPDFEDWVRMTTPYTLDRLDPADVRATLLARYWPASAARPPRPRENEGVDAYRWRARRGRPVVWRGREGER